MIVLDTHVWLWWVNEDDKYLPLAWKSRIESADEVGVAAISCFEVAWLERHGRIVLPCVRAEWFEKALAGSGISLLSVTPEIVGAAVDLPEHHRDPQDRMIIATALVYRAELMSADKAFLQYDELAGLLVS